MIVAFVYKILIIPTMLSDCKGLEGETGIKCQDNSGVTDRTLEQETSDMFRYAILFLR